MVYYIASYSSFQCQTFGGSWKVENEWVEMNVLCIADQDHHWQVIAVDHISKCKSHLVDIKPTTYGLQHWQWYLTSELPDKSHFSGKR